VSLLALDSFRSAAGVAELETPRLVLRRWRACDLRPCAAMNADPEVMRHYPRRLTRAATAALIERMEAHFAAHGFGFWVLEERTGGGFAGFLGLNRPAFDPPGGPCVEIGWRLARAHWGKGYATEAAGAVLTHAFEALDLAEVAAFTVPANARSLAVMRRLGMSPDPDGDFDHPWIAADHPLCRHVTRRMTCAQWRAGRRSVMIGVC
jgi:RimJ/RimL family protein N-acetyltransferase